MSSSYRNYSTPSDPKTFPKTVNMLYLAIMAGLFVFTGVAYFLVGESGGFAPELEETFKLIVPILAIGAAAAGYFIYSVFINKIEPNAAIEDKLTSFRNASLLRYGLWDGGGLFSILGYLLTGNIIFLGFLFPILALFILFGPTKTRIVNDLNLSSSEEKQLG